MRLADRIVMVGAFLAGGCGLISGASDLHTGPLDDAPLDGSLDGVGADGRIDLPDGTSPDASPPDASTDASPPRCDPAKDFGAPVAVGGVNTILFNDFGSSLSPDERTIYFASDRPGGLGGFDLYTATRADINQPFANVTALTVLNSASDDRHPTVSADGLVLVFRINVGAGLGDFSIAQRPTTASPFGAPTPLTTVNSAVEEADPFLTPSGDTLYFVTNHTPAGTSGIWAAPRVGTGYGTPVVVGGLLGLSDPTLSADELTIFVGGVPLAGLGQEILMATRTSKTAAFGPTTTLTALNSKTPDQPDWLSPDGCRLYLTSARDGTSDLFVATRPLLP